MSSVPGERREGVRTVKWLGRRLPQQLGRYSLKLGAGREGAAYRRKVVLEARRLGWLKKPVMDD